MSYNQHNGDGLYNRFGVKECAATRQKKRNARLGSKNPMFGKTGILSPHYGKKHSAETKQKQSNGIKKYCENRPQEHNNNISKSLRGNAKLSERMQGKNNTMYGIPASDYNKLMTKLKNSGDNNPMKKPEHQRQCPHCGKSGQMTAMKRWHFDNCKQQDIARMRRG